MSKYIYKILSICLAAVSFIQTAAGQVWRRADIDEGMCISNRLMLYTRANIIWLTIEITST